MIYYLKEIAEQYGKSPNIMRERIQELTKKKKFKKTESGYGYNEKDVAALEKLLDFTFDREWAKRAAAQRKNNNSGAAA